jgi:glucosylglycerol-phosphate synthase
LNDLDLLRAGFFGVAVGNAEPGLLEKTRSLPKVYHAQAPGAGGILEAMEHFGFSKKHPAFGAEEKFPAAGSAQVILSYHRLPYEETVVNGRPHRTPPKSPNGIIPTLLNYFVSKKPGIWLAADPSPKKREDYQKNVKLDDDNFPMLEISRVPLLQKDYDLFYKVFSKEALWPIIFSFPERAKFVDAHWEHFCHINRVFAEQIAEQAQEKALVWMHDYNQWMVPAYLRQFRPDLRIAFFHHTAFPSADIFNIIPWSNEIVGSLLKCDYVGFHIPQYVANFVQVARSHAPLQPGNRQSFAPRFLTYGCALGIDESYTELRSEHQVTRLGAHPVGVNVSNIRTRLRGEALQEKIKTLGHHYQGCKVVLSIERLDYVKGPVQKLQAFEQLLEDHPEWHGKVTLVNICPPAADQMTIYRSVQTQMEQAVGRINGRFSKPGWNPVEFFFRAFSFDEVLAYYALADVCWVTPLRDGLNLVAKEYVAVRDTVRKAGVLVLSEFAGASTELKGALLTNPYHQSDLSNKLLRGLEMPPEESLARLNKMAATISHYDIARWAEDFLQAASQTPEPSATVQAS